MTQKKYTIYTDGSCCGNPGKGGYAAIIRQGRLHRTITGSVPNSTNNRMELTAVIAGLTSVAHGSSVTVLTDSQYVQRSFSEGYLSAWQQNGWRRIKTGEPIQNRDLWTVLCDVIRERDLDVKFMKITAHKSNYFNNRADYLARQAAIHQSKNK